MGRGANGRAISRIGQFPQLLMYYIEQIQLGWGGTGSISLPSPICKSRPKLDPLAGGLRKNLTVKGARLLAVALEGEGKDFRRSLG